MDNGDYFAAPVQWAVDNDVIGIDGPCFNPAHPVTPGETALWLWNVSGQPAATSAHGFTDVAEPWQQQPVSWLLEAGITHGTTPTTFSPDDTLNRGQAAAFLHRLAGEPAPTSAHGFTDVVAGWQQQPVSWLLEAGITAGTSKTTFSPDDTLNRGHLVTFLYRYQNKPAVTINPNSPTCDAFTAISVGRAVVFPFDVLPLRVGPGHACGIRTSGTVECWGSKANERYKDEGYNLWGKADAPAGVFTAVSAGSGHSCGIRTSGTVECWGNNRLGQADAPEGVFTAIATSDFFSCGIRTSGTVECWGSYNVYGQPGVPEGVFTAISASGSGACGIKTDRTVKCWGGERVEVYHRFGLTDAPEGVFTAISAASSHTCGIKTDRTVKCWGYNDDGQANAPGGAFTAISAGSSHTCGIKTDRTVKCWGGDARQADAPAGVFTAISASDSYTCGIKTDRTAQCWGYNDDGRFDLRAT